MFRCRYLIDLETVKRGLWKVLEDVDHPERAETLTDEQEAVERDMIMLCIKGCRFGIRLGGLCSRYRLVLPARCVPLIRVPYDVVIALGPEFRLTVPNTARV